MSRQTVWRLSDTARTRPSDPPSHRHGILLLLLLRFLHWRPWRGRGRCGGRAHDLAHTSPAAKPPAARTP